MNRIPLTQEQLSIWMASREAGIERNYDLPYLFPLGPRSEEELARLARAVEQAAAAHPGLRARIVEENGLPFFVPEGIPPIRVKVETAASRKEMEACLGEYGPDGVLRVWPFDLQGGLCTLRIFQTPEGAFFYMNVHHTIMDLSAGQVFFRDISLAYNTNAVPQAEAYTFMDACADEQTRRSSPAFEEDLKWYTETFATDEFSRWPNEPDTECETGEFRRAFRPLTIPPEKIGEACARFGISKNTLFNGAFAYLLAALNHSDEASYATVFHGRTDPRFRETVAAMVRSLPVRIRVGKDATLGEYLSAIQEQTKETRRRNTVSTLDLNRTLRWKFNFFFTYEGPITLARITLGKEIIPGIDLRVSEYGIDFAVDIVKRQDGYTAEISYYRDALSPEDVEKFIALYDQVLSEVTEKEYVRDIEILTEKERLEMIRHSAGPHMELDVTKTVPALIADQVRLRPDAIALDDDTDTLSYGEMERRANILARQLMDRGVRQGDFVGILLDRSVLFPVCALAIQKAGAAYLPLDLEYPPERLRYMMENANARVLITTREILADRESEGIFRAGINLFPEDVDFTVEVPATDLSTPDGNAYMIYTSGSTGLPKGVVLHHAGLMNLVAAVAETEELTEKDRIGIHCSFCFDGSIDQLFPILTRGGSLHIMPSGIRKDTDEIVDFLNRHHITGTGFTTPLAMLIARRYAPEDVRFMSIGGEKLTGLISDRIIYHNQYGPTECTDIATNYILEQKRVYDDIPIGTPLPNLWCFVVDRFGHLVPDGFPGEICIAGIQVGRGYWQLPEKTSEVYEDCPFVEKDAWGRKVRMYHTGDMGKRGPDGQLYYIGRIDNQIKLNGFRIELGEIENAAVKYPGIIRAAAAVKNKILCLYYTSEEPLDEEQISEFLSRTLAEYMIPGSIMRMDAIPETPNGKVDRKALPEPGLTARKTAFTAPRNDTERKICAAFEKVLNLQEGSVGINDDFFTIGGDSLRAMQVMSDAGLEGLSARMIFRSKTAAAIAEELADLTTENLEEYEQKARSMRLPVTSAQEIMFIDLELEPDSVMFNLPGFFRLDAVTDAERLARAVDLAAAAHPGLCTAFDHDEDGRIIQYIRPDYPEKTVVRDVTPEELEELKSSLIRPFEPFGEPLFRSKVFRCEGTVYLFVDMLHMVSDGSSLDALYRDIARAYRGEALSRDYIYSYIRKEAETKQTPAFEKARKYFADLLGDRNWCRLPTFDHDTNDPAWAQITAKNIMPIERMARAEKRMGYSRNVIAITATMLALREYCGRDRVSVDYVNNNRMEKYLRDAVGLVFKTLPLAVDVSRYASREELLKEVNRQEIESFVNSVADYTAKEDVEAEDAIAVNYVSNLGSGASLEGLEAEELELETDEDETMGGHMDLYVQETEDSVSLALDYTKYVYEQENMRRFLDLIVRFLMELTEDPA